MTNAMKQGGAMAVLLLALAGCGGNSSDSDGGCDGTCSQRALSAAEVERVIAQAVAEAESLDQAVTIAVTDRVGNVLAVFRMDGAAADTRITGRRGVEGGLEGLVVPAELAAISKAGTAAYLSSQGNAFTTRTASQIVQEHFNPRERDRPAGPLFGVQFTQLPCGDLVTRFSAGTAERNGPHRLPLGLAGDPGGVPLYLDSDSPDGRAGRVLVGGIGVEGVAETNVDAEAGDPARRALYSVDLSVSDIDQQLEERIAVAGARGFAAPRDRRAERIAVDGKFLRFVDDEPAAVVPPEPFATLPGKLVGVPGFAAAEVQPGVVLGTAASGYLETVFAGIPAEVLVDAEGRERFPPRDADANRGLSADEVQAVLANALAVAERTRAQIRRPLGTAARVTIVVVDAEGAILGVVRGRDAPVFGTDTALQKARTAAFFSSASAGEELQDAATPRYPGASPIADYVIGARVFLGDATALTGRVAFSDRAGGNLSRPFFPDGIDGNPPGPFSKPFAHWSPFSTGLQLDLVFNALADVLSGVEVEACTDVPGLANGMQIFPGSVPIYRGAALVGGIGVSGDGVDQDDMIAFLGLHGAAEELCRADPQGCAAGETIGNAAPEIRADTIAVDGSHLRFVNCPVKPFIDSDDQGACDGL